MATSSIDSKWRMLICLFLLSHFPIGRAVSDVCEQSPSTAITCSFSDDFCQWRHENLTISDDFIPYTTLNGSALTARLESKPVCGHHSEYCFHFQHRLFSNNQLTVQVVQSSGASTTIWRKDTPAADSNFQAVYIPVSYIDDYQIVIVFQRTLLPIEGPYLRSASVLSFTCPLDRQRPTSQSSSTITESIPTPITTSPPHATIATLPPSTTAPTALPPTTQTTPLTTTITTATIIPTTATPPPPPSTTTTPTTKTPPASTSNPQTATTQSSLTSSLMSSTITSRPTTRSTDDVAAMTSHTTSPTRTSVSFVPSSPTAGLTPLPVTPSTLLGVSRSYSSSPPNSEAASTQTDDSSKISVGMIAGVASAIVAVATVAVVVFILCRRRGLWLWKSDSSQTTRDSNIVERIANQNMVMTAVSKSDVNAERPLPKPSAPELPILSTAHNTTNDLQQESGSRNEIKAKTPKPFGANDEEQPTGNRRLSNPYDIISTCDRSSTLDRQDGYYNEAGSQYYNTKTGGQGTRGAGKRGFVNTGPVYENGHKLQDRFQPGSLGQRAANGRDYASAVHAEGGKLGHGNIRPDGNRPNETAVDESQVYATILEDAVADDLGRLDPSCSDNQGGEYGQCQRDAYSALERYQSTEDVHDYYSLAQSKI